MMWMRVLGCVALLVLVLASGTAGGSDAHAKISSEVIEQYAHSDSARVVVLFEPHAHGLVHTRVLDEGTIARQHQLGGVRDVHDLWLINGAAMSATREAVEAIAKDPSVARVVADHRVVLQDVVSGVEKSTPEEKPITNGVLAVNATPVWLNGYTGRGVNVSIVDTGIARHPDIADRISLWADFVNGKNASPYDDNGHGTHVAGIVAGDGTDGTITGVAPSATLFDAKVFDSSGMGYESAVVEGFQWSVEHGADIISYSGGGCYQEGDGSWYHADNTTAGGTRYHSYTFSASHASGTFPLTFIIAECELYTTDAYNHTNISLIAPNGSVVRAYPVDWVGEHPTKRMIKYMEDKPLAGGTWRLAVSSDINTSYRYRVNALYMSDGASLVDMAARSAVEAGTLVVAAAGNAGEMGLRTISAPAASPYSIAVGATHADMDTIADFSSRGPVGFTSVHIKPDVCAPGVDILSLDAFGSGYVRKSGTSMATPFVSGVAALMLDANSSLTPQQVRDALESTAVDLGERGKDNTYGWGRVDAWRAVNAITPLKPSTSFTSGGLQLFGGSLTDDVLMRPPIFDPKDSGADADVLAAGLEILPSSSTADLFITTRQVPDPSRCEYRVYVDVDNSSSTGVPMHGIGVDRWLVVNSTSSVLFDANGSILGSDVPWHVEDNTLWIRPSKSQMKIASTGSSMRFFVQAGCGSKVDTAPDTGYGTYPYQLKLGGFAVLWNTSTRAPAPNESVRFELYGWNNSTHAYDVPMGTVNATTNENGYANASFVCSSTSTWGDGLVRVSSGDISVEDTLRWYAALPTPEPMFTPTLTPVYTVSKDGVLNVSYTLVRADFTPFNGKVALVFGTPVVGYPHVQVNLTPSNGTVSYSLDLNSTTLDDDASFEIYLLNGTVQSHDYIVWAGTANVMEKGARGLFVVPSFVRLPPLKSTTLLVLTKELDDDAPLTRDVHVDVYWLSEAEVRQLSVAAFKDGKRISTRALSDPQLERLQEVVEEHTSNLKYPAEHSVVATSSYGVGMLNLTPPEGAYFGLVVLTDGRLVQRASILVRDPHLYDRLLATPELPSIDVSVKWYAEGNGSAYIAEPNLTVDVEMYHLNESTLARKPVVGEPLHIVLSTGETREVLTDAWGRARAVFSAPKLDDVVNSTPMEVGYTGISPWSVGVIVISNRADESGGMLSAHGYGPIRLRTSHAHAIPELGYANGTLATSITWEDTKKPASGVPTVLDVVRRMPASESVREVLLSKYINDSSTSHTESVGAGKFGEYRAYATTWESTLHGGTMETEEDDAGVMPVEVLTDVAEWYPLNATFPVYVRCSYLNGTPIPNALVYVSQTAGCLQADPRYISYAAEPPVWSSLDINHTDEAGTAVLHMRTPPQDARVEWVLGVSTKDELFVHARSGTFNATSNHPPVSVVHLNHTINNAGYPVYLNGSQSHDSGTIASYLWHLGDGTEATGASVSHVYASYRWNGMAYKPFMVRLTVRDSSGAANTTTVPVSVYMQGDANGDGRANILDAALVGLHWQSAYGSAEYSDGADLNNDDVVNILDATIVGLNWNRKAGGM